MVDTWTTYLWDRPKLKKDFERFSDGESTMGVSQIRAYLADRQLPHEEAPLEEEVAELLGRFVRPVDSDGAGLSDVGLYFFSRTARRTLRNRREASGWFFCTRRRPASTTLR